MSRHYAIDALAGGGTAFGVAWLPPEIAPVSCALGAGADFLFVALRGPETRDRIAELHEAGIAAFVSVQGPVGVLAERLGYADLSRGSVGDPSWLAVRLREAVSDSVAAVRMACSIGADAIVVGDDLAAPGTWLIDPAFASKVVVPLEGSCAEAARDCGVPAIFHSDGAVDVLYRTLAASGFSAVHIASGDTLTMRRGVRSAVAEGLVPAGGVTAASLGVEPVADVALAATGLVELGLALVCDDGGLTTNEQTLALSEVIGMIRSRKGHL